MTPKEAIEYLNIMKLSTEDDSVGEIKKEVCDIAIEALEKQIPKKPIIWDERTHYAPDEWGYECPCCGNRDIDYSEHHCECGQAIDWSEEE